MPSNKDRLYVALYVRGGKATMPNKEDTYHWGLIVGPKVETDNKTGVRYHAKERIKIGGSEWQFEESPCPLSADSMLLVRIMVGKVANVPHLIETLRGTPIRGGQSGWNCISWVKEALKGLAEEKTLGTCVLDWTKVRDESMAYCQRKKDEHRFDGLGKFDMKKPATYDLLTEKDIIC
ncbi:hypothetical protein N7508_010831 [Penicillium antarcticum]|uniref:uncharacterized protein n=1 Tax=Penicillium antarcticum TaxID=416450 RepID=UPI00239B054A|nr:uncharacterized protein N7508_010831 [Penicillium antarcticum]KAJ5296010.1 hypothetical protein N7508_010831 [Penicillium antarcticum]